MLNADPSFVSGGLLIAPDSPAVNAAYAAGGAPHPVFALFESTYPGVGGIARDITGGARPSCGGAVGYRRRRARWEPQLPDAANARPDVTFERAYNSLRHSYLVRRRTARRFTAISAAVVSMDCSVESIVTVGFGEIPIVDVHESGSLGRRRAAYAEDDEFAWVPESEPVGRECRRDRG